jgi:hypothetical protein
MVKLRTRSQYLVHGPIAPSNFPVRGLYWLTASTLIFYTCEESVFPLPLSLSQLHRKAQTDPSAFFF